MPSLGQRKEEHCSGLNFSNYPNLVKTIDVRGIDRKSVRILCVCAVPSTQFWLITHSHTRSVPSTQFWLITHSHTRSVPSTQFWLITHSHTRSVPSTQFWLITHSHTRSVPSTQFWLITHSHTRSVPRHLQSLGGPEGPEGPDLRAEEAAVLHQAVLLAAINRRCGKVISVQSLTLSDRLFRCLPRLGPPSTVPRVMVLERVTCLMTWPNHASFRRLTVARRGSWGATRLLSRLRT